MTTYAPGGIATEMVAGKRFDSLRSWLMPADECAVEGIDAFVKRRYLKIPGQLNRIGAVLMRLLPQKLVAIDQSQPDLFHHSRVVFDLVRPSPGLSPGTR